MRKNILSTNWKILFLTLLVFISHSITKAQILQDTVTADLIKKGIGFIYNQEFNDAESVLTQMNTKYPGHPANYLFNGILIYYKNYPLIQANPESRIFERQLKTSIRLCEDKAGWLEDPEKLLIDLCSRGLLLLFYSENSMNREIIPFVISTYKSAMQSFNFTSTYPDFSYFAGLYNYYRETYPEFHPVYKPVAMLFRHGDKQKGLQELQHSAENSIIMKAESYSVLSWIFMYYERDFTDALNCSRTLYELYPSNLFFKGELIKNLVLMKKYDEAEKMIQSSLNVRNQYYQAQLCIFNGLVQEKKYQNLSAAENYYRKGISDMEIFDAVGEEYVFYGHKGLDRLKAIREGRVTRKKKTEITTEEVDIDLLNFD